MKMWLLRSSKKSFNFLSCPQIKQKSFMWHITDFQPKPAVMKIDPFGASPQKFRYGSCQKNNIITARKSTTLLPFLSFGTFPEFNFPPPRNCAHFAFWPPRSQSFRLVVWWNGPNCGSNLDPSKSLRLQWTTFCVSFSGQSDCFLICQYFLIFDALSIKKPLVGFPITVWIDIRTATRKPWRSSPEFIATLVWLNSLQLNDL